jgi:hypothetical protein
MRILRTITVKFANILLRRCRFLDGVFVFKIVTESLESRTMMSLMEFTSIFSARLVPNRKHPVGSASALRKLNAYVACVVSKLRKLAPYAAIELLLPGGSVIALLLWFYRTRRKAGQPGNPLGMPT